MPVKKSKDGGRPGASAADGAGGGEAVDPTRAAFTSAIVAALKDLENRKTPSGHDLGQQAYQKLQYDLPLVSSEELQGLAETLRASLQLKSGQPPFPLTAKLLENIVAGARAPLATTTAAAPPSQPPSQSAVITSDSSTDAVAGGAAPGSDAGVGVASHAANGTADGDDEVVVQVLAQPPPPDSLLEPGLLQSDRQELCGSFRVLCAVVFVQLVSHCLAVSEQDTWALLHGLGSGAEGPEDGDAAEQPLAEEADGTVDGRVNEMEAEEPQSLSHAEGTGSADPSQQQHQSDSLTESGSRGFRSNSCQDSDGPDGAAEDGSSLDVSATDMAVQETLRSLQLQAGSSAAGNPAAAHSHPPRELYEQPQALEEDGDDFVFEELDAPGSSTSAVVHATIHSAPNGNGGGWGPGHLATGPASPPPPPYDWPELRARLLRLAGQVSYALLDDPEMWRDGELLQGVFQLLRALGAHRHAQELQPLLHAYMGLVSDRIAAEPEELACLDSLWDAVGVPCIATLPQVGRQRQASGCDRGQGLLLAEASTCLSLVATLAGQLTGASAKLRLWQQVNKHMLPLLERCLSELARAVGPGQGKAAAKVAAAAAGAAAAAPATKQSEATSPGPEEVAAIVLVCQVLAFYVQQRPGNADLPAALKSTGVLASLSVLFAAAGGLPGAEPLRSAALCCAASSRELHTWMLAVPGVAHALAGPGFQEGGPLQAHGAVWQLLGNSGASPLALSILAGGAAPEKAVRVHALLQLLAMVAACRGGRGSGGGGALWNTDLERAMRELFTALRQEQAANSAAAGRNAGRTEVHGQRGEAQRNGGGEGPAAGPRGQQVGEDEGQDAIGVVGNQEEEEEEDKLHLLDPAALQRRRARQLHPACWRILKQILTASGDVGGKTD